MDAMYSPISGMLRFLHGCMPHATWVRLDPLLCSKMHVPAHLDFLKQVTRGICLSSLR